MRAFGSDFPDPRVVPFGEGLDNAAFLVDDAWVFRFPRDEARAWYMRRELAVLPGLPALPVEVPRPRYVDPSPFAGYRRLSGTPASLAEGSLDAVAPALGRALRALHGVALSADGTPPRTGKTDRGLALRRIPAPLRALAERLADAPPAAEARWVHGDLYPRHLLLDDAGELTGIIDWGDVHRGDVAVDLSIAFGWLPPGPRARFFDAYGAIDAATARRARFVALYYGVVLAEVAETLQAPDLARLAHTYRAHVLAEGEA